MSEKKTLFIASDHAGFELKKKIIETLGSGIEDLGPSSADSVDYPDYAHRLCLKIKAALKEQGAESPKGILICGSGQGVAMVANKYPEIRAALCWSKESAELARKHNDANVLCLPSRLVDESTNLKIIKSFMETSFEGGRHEARVKKIPI